MKKLLISKTESVAEVVERILGEEDSDLVLVVPRGSALGGSIDNFRLIGREAASAGKTIAVESVDETILALAKAGKIRAAHPLFSASYREGQRSRFSDIVPREERSEIRTTKAPRKRKIVKKEETDVEVAFHPEVWEAESASAEPNGAAERDVSEIEEQKSSEESFRLRLPHRSRLRLGRRFVIIIVIVIVLGFTGWVLSGPFARATITVNFEKIPWEKEGIVLLDTSVSGINFDKNVLPAELFTMTKNLTHLFPASGEEEVAEKAKGKIWIYNAFSSAPQILVATTRFETPDGKIFRIVKQVTVPGAVVKDGKITPTGVEVDIVADKPGPEYNVGPIKRLSIPGFKGTPRYAGFYGEIKEPTKGGFIGKRRVPTTADIKNAKARMEELLKGGVETAFVAGYPKEFKILEGASRIDITRLNVDNSTDDKGNFSVFGEARIRAIGFKESDLRALLEKSAQEVEKGTTFKELELSYSNIKPDFEKGTMSFSLKAGGLLWPKFSSDEFKKNTLGKKISEARLLIASLPRLARGKISIWPIWLWRIPSDPEKVKVVVE